MVDSFFVAMAATAPVVLVALVLRIYHKSKTISEAELQANLAKVQEEIMAKTVTVAAIQKAAVRAPARKRPKAAVRKKTKRKRR